MNTSKNRANKNHVLPNRNQWEYRSTPVVFIAKNHTAQILSCQIKANRHTNKCSVILSIKTMKVNKDSTTTLYLRTKEHDF